jgi:hypothetical protein
MMFHCNLRTLLVCAPLSFILSFDKLIIALATKFFAQEVD